MKIRLFLVLVILYILAAFGWWLYSLITFTNRENEHEKNHLNYKCAIIEDKLIQFIHGKAAEDDNISNVIEANSKEFNTLLSQLKKENGIEAEVHINNTTDNFHEAITIKPSVAEMQKINRRYESKIRAFYSEAIVFTLAVILGVLWVFSRLEALLNLNRMQNNFLLSVTHELKTPLAVIKLSAQTLKSRKLNEEMYHQVIQQTLQNSDRLNELIDNVLLATKIDGKSYAYNFEKLSLTDIIHKAADQTLIAPIFKGSVSIPDSEFYVSGDEVALNLVFTNIFQNALKYGGENVAIKVAMLKEGNRINVAVADNGPGIPVEEREKIFRKFYRIGDEDTRHTKGTGLGLFLVKQILKIHHAKITVDPSTEKGARFIISFKSTNNI